MKQPKRKPNHRDGEIGFSGYQLILRGQSVTAQERTDGFSSNLHLYERISGNNGFIEITVKSHLLYVLLGIALGVIGKLGQNRIEGVDILFRYAIF
jgi:hypothetical protein